MSEIEGPDAPVAATKQDPETLVLRGRPRPVVRFRRGLIIGTGAFAAAALAGLAWFALEPPSFRLVGAKAAPELARVNPDGVADAPASYAEVPQLGPPLPGDLGRPILEQQRRSGPQLEAGGSIANAEAERQRLAEHLAEAEAARTSPVLVRLASAPAPLAIGPIWPASSGPLHQPDAGAATREGQQRKIDFISGSSGDASSDGVVAASSPWTLSAGTVIPASLITGINSDLPGIVLAQVTEQVRDSATGTIVLIPQGARLVGSYDSMVEFGQKRALIVWQRIIFPDGSSVRLDNVPATDASGYAGLEDGVDFHAMRLLKGIALSTLLGVGSELSLDSGESDLVRAIERSAQQGGARTGDQLVSRSLEVQPTLTIRPGWPVRALIHQDLVLKPWRG